MSAQTVLLSRKLERLRMQYKNNSENMESIRKNYENTINTELEEMRADIHEKIISHNEALDLEYEKEFERYTKQMNKHLNTEVEKINTDYAKLKRENDDMRIEMDRIEKEIFKELHNTEHRIVQKENFKRQEAEERMEKVYDIFCEFSKSYPHEFFEPNAADALLMQMEQTKVDFRLGFYEACMANSSSLEFQIASIEDRIKKSFEQWKRYFFQLESYVIQIKEFIDSEKFRIIQSDFFEKELFFKSEKASDTFDFWCGGEYSDLLLQIEKYEEFTERLCKCKGDSREEKIVDFLKNQRKYGNICGFEELADMIRSITEIHKRMCSLMQYIHTNFISSYMRAVVISSDIVRELADARGCEIIKKGFKDSDIRKEYNIYAREAGKNISISIFPVCPDKTVIINSIGIYVEYTGNGTAENLMATAENLVAQIKSASHGVGVVIESNRSFDNIEKALQSIKDTAIEKRIKEISAKRRMLR